MYLLHYHTNTLTEQSVELVTLYHTGLSFYALTAKDGCGCINKTSTALQLFSDASMHIGIYTVRSSSLKPVNPQELRM